MIDFFHGNKRLSLHPILSIVLFFMLMISCKQESGTGDPSVSDTTVAVAADEALQEVGEEEGESTEEDKGPAALWPKGIIRYGGTVDDDTKRALRNFTLLTPVLDAAARSVAIKDSLEMLPRQTASGEGSDQLTDPSDSAVFRPLEIIAWEAINTYKKQVATGASLKDQCPSLLGLTRKTQPDDKTSGYLPAAGPSRYLSHGKFFFLGGAPFIHEMASEDGTPFTDAKGNPEKRFSSSLTDNGEYMLNSLYHFRSVHTNITLGPPLRSYDMGPQEVNGVGSLIHEFREPYDVFFLTEAGVIPARLISVAVKLVPENLGCVSDQPDFIFTCGKNISPLDILAVYVPYHSEPVTECKIQRHTEGVWTADLNDDGVADLACVSSAFEGIASDTMAEVLWFVNINGTWKIIDYAAELDCT